MSFVGRQLQRVLIVPDDGTEDPRVQSVELYHDGVIVCWMSTTSAGAIDFDGEDWTGYGPQIEGPVQPWPRFTQPEAMLLADDLGTTYDAGRARAGGGRDVMRGECQFQPAVPADATSLVVSFGERSVEVKLTA